MNESYKSIKLKNNKLLEIYSDDSAESPDEWGDDNLFLVGYHRDFTVKRDTVITKDEAIEIGQGGKNHLTKKYHCFGLEAYIHGGVVLSFRDEGNFPDRRWDVSYLGLVLVAKEEWKTREKAKKAAAGLIEDWNNYLSGNIYGFILYETSICDHGEEHKKELDSCWGFYGDPEESGILDHISKEDLPENVKELI